MSAHVVPKRLGVLVAAVTIAAFGVGGGVLADENGEIIQPVDHSRNVVDAPSPVTNAVFGTDNSMKSGQVICTTPTPSAPNVNTDCEAAPGPHNETSIAINPTDPANMIGGANDYQLGLNPGGSVSVTVLSRAHVTTDGGQTWTTYPINFTSTYQATGDPAIAFDDTGHAYYSTLGFRFTGTTALNPDILVANSGDGGVHWQSVRVAAGSGNFSSVGDLLDKEYITAWGAGNALVTFGDFRLGIRGSYVSATIYSSVTHDYGKTWSTPVPISGQLHDAFASVPVVTSDRSAIYVAFMHTFDAAGCDPSVAGSCRDKYYVVKLDPMTGVPVPIDASNPTNTEPVEVGLVYDGYGDYPMKFGRQTYQDSVFRTWAAGNLAADPTNPDHLAVVWSDMRNSTPVDPSNPDPYTATTNSDVIVSQSTDGGKTWSAPQAISRSNDQFMPWGAFDWNGDLRIGFFDRSVDPANHKYGYTVGTWDGGSGLSSATLVTGAVQSDPTTKQRWFARTVNSGFPSATAFLGDYSNIAVVPPNAGAGTDGTDVAAYWTDLRENATFADVTRKGQDAYFALLSNIP